MMGGATTEMDMTHSDTCTVRKHDCSCMMLNRYQQAQRTHIVKRFRERSRRYHCGKGKSVTNRWRKHSDRNKGEQEDMVYGKYFISIRMSS